MAAALEARPGFGSRRRGLILDTRHGQGWPDDQQVPSVRVGEGGPAAYVFIIYIIRHQPCQSRHRGSGVAASLWADRIAVDASIGPVKRKTADEFDNGCRKRRRTRNTVWPCSTFRAPSRLRRWGWWQQNRPQVGLECRIHPIRRGSCPRLSPAFGRFGLSPAFGRFGPRERVGIGLDHRAPFAIAFAEFQRHDSFLHCFHTLRF